ncbi:MAG: hypothetical protein K2L23_05380, partial [Odoribacter sp.]|nr:hypothetical protein [Odoribacter sp.]
MDMKKNKKEAVKDGISPSDSVWLGRLNAFLDKRLTLIFLLSLGLMLMLSYALFDVRVSLTGDDAAYVERGKRFLDSFSYPTFQGPLYPIFLSVCMVVFGMNIIMLKVVSLFCLLGFQTFTFLTLRHRVPAFLTSAVLLLVAFNAEILYYASQTYSEAFYMLLVAWALWFYVTHFVDRNKVYPIGKQIGMALILAVLLMCMGLARSVGFVGIIVILVFGFSYRKYWKDTCMVFGAFVLVYLVWSLLKWMLWGKGGADFSGQLSMLLQKDVYNANVGREDFGGFLIRFWENMKNYISYHFYEILGLRKYAREMPTSASIALLTFLLGFIGLLASWRRNKVVYLFGLYAGGFLVLTFFIMQVFWNQGRLIVPVVPYLLLLLLSFFYYFPKQKWHPVLYMLLPALVGLVFLTETGRLAGKAREARKVTNKYYGLTPDWMNYVRASEWAAEELPKEAVVACRKPSISFIYGNGRKFYGVMSVPTGAAAEWLENYRQSPEEYVIIAGSELEKDLPVELTAFFMAHLEAFYFSGRQVYFIIKGDALSMTDFRKLLASAQVKDEENLVLKEKDFVVYPDKLLQQFKENSVDYVLSANLRIDPSRKTNRTINTVERYMGYISQKYPQTFVKVMQV